MTKYPETTLAEFKELALKHARGEKAAVTICWKGLPRRERWIARNWMRERREVAMRSLAVARLHLDTQRVAGLTAQRNIWSDLIERLHVEEGVRP